MQSSVSPSTLLVGLVFASVSLLTFAILRALLVRSEIKRRTQMRPVAELAASSGRMDETIPSEFLSFVGKLFPPTSADGHVRKELIKAGFFSPHAVLLYHAARILLPLGLPLVLLVAMSLLPWGLSARSSLLGVVCVCGLGFIGPSLYLN